MYISHTGFFMEELNSLKYCANEVGNAYLNSDAKKKLFVVSGPKFESELTGRILIVFKVLYRLLISDACFHKHLVDTLCNLGLHQFRANHSIWIGNREEFYKYLASLMKDLLVYSKNPWQL